MEEVLLIGSLEEGKMEYQARGGGTANISLKAHRRSPVNNRRAMSDQIVDCRSACRDPGRRTFAATHLHEFADQRGEVFSRRVGGAVRDRCAGSAIVYAVQDQGIGIPEVDESGSSTLYRGRNVGDRPGTRLGLLIVKRCVDLHGGKIKVNSRTG